MEYYRHTKEEQETTININRADDYMTVWTSDRTMMTKLDKLCQQYPTTYILTNTGLIDGQIADKEYRINDKTLFSFKGRHRQAKAQNTL